MMDDDTDVSDYDQRGCNNYEADEFDYYSIYTEENKVKLIEAINENNLELLSHCSLPRNDITLKTKIKRWRNAATTVMLAAHRGSADCLQKLFEMGVELHSFNGIYRHALLLAAEGEHNDCMRLISRSGLLILLGKEEEDDLDELSAAVETLDFQLIENIAERGGKETLNLFGGQERSTNAINFLLLSGCPVECLQSLINSKSEINVRDRQGFTPLISAVVAGNVESVRWLLENGAKVDMRDKTDRSRFLHEFYYNETFDYDDKGDMIHGDKKTALMFASMLNRIDCVDVLLKNGADVNKKDEGGFTALMHAANSKNHECVEKILSSSLRTGLNINAVNNAFKTALMIAAYNGDDKSVELLLKSKAIRVLKDTSNRTAFMAAVLSDNIDCVKMLFRVQAEIDAKDTDSQTPLVAAVKSNNVDILKFLLEKTNMPLHLKRENANSIFTKPLFSALQLKSLELVGLLLKYGADVNSKDSEGRTPLMIACQTKNTSMFYFLIQNGANIHAINRTKKSVLMYALYLETECVSFLIKKGADLNTMSSSKQTLLMKACEIGRPDCVKLLLENGAASKINARDNENKPALMYAVDGRCADCFKILLGAGANVDIVAGHHTIFGYSMEKQCLRHFELLVESGKIFDDDGSVKKLHTKHIYQRISSFTLASVELPFLVILLKLGVFMWKYFSRQYDNRCWIAMVMGGISPGTFTILKATAAFYHYPLVPRMLAEYGLNPHLSPLKYALLKSDLGLTQYILANLYLTTDDYKFLVLDKTLQHTIGVTKPNDELVQYSHQLASQPWKLEILCFVNISTEITKINQGKNKGGNIRSKIVDSLPLPEKFKTRLKFGGPMSSLCPSVWKDIGKPPWLKQRQNVLSLTTSIWPHFHLLVPCQQAHCCCNGVCHVVQFDSSTWS